MTGRGTMAAMSVRPTAPTTSAVTPAESMEEAIASTRLEGLDLPPEFLADAALVAAGEIDADELRARTNTRHGR